MQLGATAEQVECLLLVKDLLVAMKRLKEEKIKREDGQTMRASKVERDQNIAAGSAWLPITRNSPPTETMQLSGLSLPKWIPAT